MDRSDAPEYRVLSERRHKAAREYPCDLCRKPILAGSQYFRVAFVEDGVFGSARQHSRFCWMSEEAA